MEDKCPLQPAMLSVQKRVKIVGLTLLSLEMPDYKVALAGTWELGFQEDSHPPN